MTKFTATEAYEASQDGEPIMITKATVAGILDRHDAEGADEFLAGCDDVVDAWSVLSWLGY